MLLAFPSARQLPCCAILSPSPEASSAAARSGLCTVISFQTVSPVRRISKWLRKHRLRSTSFFRAQRHTLHALIFLGLALYDCSSLSRTELGVIFLYHEDADWTGELREAGPPEKLVKRIDASMPLIIIEPKISVVR